MRGKIMKEAGKKNNYLIPWGMKKLHQGHTLLQVGRLLKDAHKKSLKEIKELVKQ